MSYLSIILTLLLTSIVTPLILSYLKKKNKIKEEHFDKNNFHVKYNVIFIIFYNFFYIVFFSLYVVSMINEKNLDTRIIISFLPILFLLLFGYGIYTIDFCSFKVTENGIEIKSFFKRKKYSFNDIHYITKCVLRFDIVAYNIYTYKRIYELNDEMAGCNLFIEIAKKNNIYIFELKK